MKSPAVAALIALVLAALGFLASCGAEKSAEERKVLYWANPMDPTVKSDKPMKDSMGMDYVPVYADEAPRAAAEKKILYWANPMDPTVKSDKPMKDSMGMDYVPVYADEGAGQAKASGIRLSENQEALIGVRTAKVERKVLDRTLAAVGKIAYSEKRSALLSARFAGRVERLLVNYTGASVDEGEPLLVVYSPALVTAQQELLQTYGDLRQGGPAASLAERLFESAKGKLLLWGLTDEQVRGILKGGKPMARVPLLSPIKGTVVKLNVAAGQYVEEGAVLFELSDLSKVWLEAEIYEQDLGSVSLASTVRMRSLSYPEKTVTGRVDFLSPAIDPATRTARLRVEVDNADRLLKPGMFVNVEVVTPAAEAVLAVPETALLDTGDAAARVREDLPGQVRGAGSHRWQEDRRLLSRRQRSRRGRGSGSPGQLPHRFRKPAQGRGGIG